jgi:hypothetical protein
LQPSKMYSMFELEKISFPFSKDAISKSKLIWRSNWSYV